MDLIESINIFGILGTIGLGVHSTRLWQLAQQESNQGSWDGLSIWELGWQTAPTVDSGPSEHRNSIGIWSKNNGKITVSCACSSGCHCSSQHRTEKRTWVSTSSATNRTQDRSKSLNYRPVSSHVEDIKQPTFMAYLPCAWFYSRHQNLNSWNAHGSFLTEVLLLASSFYSWSNWLH